MLFRQLEHFVAVARERHFVRAAPVARAFSACAQKLSLDEFFDARLLGLIGRR